MERQKTAPSVRVPLQLSHRQIAHRKFVYLTYIDDSDTKAKQQQWQVLAAVLIPDDTFFMLEVGAADVVRRLMPEDQYEEFTEFHACELYGGYKAFEGIDQAKRFAAIEEMLGLLPALGARVAYGAVNLEHLKRQPYASANPVDYAFRMCAEGIKSYYVAKVTRGADPDGQCYAMFITDECDQKNKAILQKSFRSLREGFRMEQASFALVHDEMYFGDSRHSIGLQVADLCSYFIARHMAGDGKTECYYRMIESMIISGRREPSSESALS